MDLESTRKLRLDRRLLNRRGWIGEDELKQALESLPDVSEKAEREGAGPTAPPAETPPAAAPPGPPSAPLPPSVAPEGAQESAPPPAESPSGFGSSGSDPFGGEGP